MKIRGLRRGLIATTVLGTALLTGGALTAQQGGAIDPVCGVDGTLAAIAGEVGRLPDNRSLEDYEGAILFTVSQIECSDAAVMDALDAASRDASLSSLERSAIANVLAELRRRRIHRGTASINGGGGLFENDSFSTPIIALGGTSATYTAQ